MEGHYSLDMACFLLHNQHPTSVRICSDDPEIVKAAVRRLGWVSGKIFVDSAILAEKLGELAQSPVEPYQANSPTDAVLLPFSRTAYSEPPLAPFIVTVSYNALSYKSLLYPGITHDTVVKTLRWLRQAYQIGRKVGLFTPRFLFDWSLSQAAGARQPQIHFRAGQRAVDNLYSSGRFWWTGYILVISAHR